jgi:uncharacterized protein YydD (DUF2326 family)
MRLESIHSLTGLFDKITFHTGINVILANYSKKPKTSRDSGTNGVGKSSIIRMISFALGSDEASRFFSKDIYSFLRLENHSCTLVLTSSKNTITLTRSFLDSSSVEIVIEDSKRIVQADKVGSYLFNFLFSIDDEDAEVIARRFGTLIKFYVKDDIKSNNRTDPLSFFDHQVKAYDKFIYNLYLMGLPTFHLEQMSRIKEESDKATQKRKAIEDLIEEELKTKISDLPNEIAKVEKKLEDLRIEFDKELLPDFIQSDTLRIEELSTEIQKKHLEFQSTDSRVLHFESLYTDSDKLDLAKVKSSYDFINGVFSGYVVKTMEELISFNQQIADSRRQYLENQISRDKKRQVEILLEVNKLNVERSMVLNAQKKSKVQGLIFQYAEKLALLKSDENKKKDFLQIYEKNKDKKKQLSKEIESNADRVKRSIGLNDSTIKNLSRVFLDLVGMYFDTSVKGCEFEIVAKDKFKVNEVPVAIKLEIPKEDAYGMTRLKIAMYDWIIFLHSIKFLQNRRPSFLIHDGLFHGVSKHVVKKAVVFISKAITENEGQYILTFNEDEFNESDITEIQANGAKTTVVKRLTNLPSEMFFKRDFK